MPGVSMPSESARKLQHIYQLQQGKLVTISHLTENINNIRESLGAFGAEQKELAGELEDCTNKCRAAIIRLERKGNRNEESEGGEEGEESTNAGGADYRSLPPARKKSFLQVMREAHDTSSSVAERIYRLSASHKYSAELLDLSVIMVKHFLWRERVFMALILGGHESRALKQVGAGSCALGRWYDGRGKKAYSHLPAYVSLGRVHSLYHTVINEFIDKGVEGMAFSELSGELAKMEMLSQQLVGLIGQIQHHVALLQKSDD